MRDPLQDLLAGLLDGNTIADEQAPLLLTRDADVLLLATAASVRDLAHPYLVSYSRKVFIPLTQLCRDVCHYCTFAHPPRRGQRAYLLPDEVLAIAKAGAAAGCKEALFTLGDKPELRYKIAERELAELGYTTTVEYLSASAALVLRETGLLPHVNPGVLTADEIATLRKVSVSQGIMLESISERLCAPGGPHYGSPDKQPQRRLETIRLAGEHKVPFTSGLLIGIGESRAERIASLLALRTLHQRYGHIQEIIIQNFRAKPGTRMASALEPDLNDLRWTIAVARLLFGPAMNIQAPPNLTPNDYPLLIAAGLNDWGGISPVTPDHVNPEAPWPQLQTLADQVAAAGKHLVERLAVYPEYALNAIEWQDASLVPNVIAAMDTDGYARAGAWSPGADDTAAHLQPLAPQPARDHRYDMSGLREIISRAMAGADLDELSIVRLFKARGTEYDAVCIAADDLRKQVNGDTVTYVVNRNINYTNICYYRCQFCAFSKGKLSENLRGLPYNLDLAEIVRRSREAWDRGATEVCLQGGIHPEYTGATYLNICEAIHSAVPGIHIHAFSPLEIWQGAHTLGIGVGTFLEQLRTAGLGTLPGTAAEILDDHVRATLCPDKLNTAQWLDVISTAHQVNLRTTSTIMYGHIERPISWARHLLHLRHLQQRTGGITEFVPLPFVHMEAPIYWKGRARKGPTFREAVLMHAVARLALHPHITNIQTSWVKMGAEGVKICLQAGVNDLGGTLMNESITRAAGGTLGQELPPARMDQIIRSLGRLPQQRTTLYRPVPLERVEASYAAAPLTELLQVPTRRYMRPE
ncbi:MAG: bifunctional FO biosynthesis protein CofGH [Herpetosiphon sp.]